MRVEKLPKRESAAWLHADGDDSEGGCDICGWSVTGEYEEVREEWLDHVHDPIVDIMHRAAKYTDSINGPSGYVFSDDVTYMFNLLEEYDKELTELKAALVELKPNA